jgi:hypothetical protein
MNGFIVVAIAAVIVGASAPSNASVAITDCGQTVPANQKGVLQGDVHCEYRCGGDRSLLCTPDGHLCEDEGKGFCDVEVVTLERGAILDLNGHDLYSAWHAPAVICGAAETGRCVVKGPGQVVAGTNAILSLNMDIVARNVTLIAEYDVARTNGRVSIANADLQAYSVGGIRAGKGLSLRNVRAGQLEVVHTGGDLTLDDVELGPSSNDVSADGTVRGRDVLLRGYASFDGRHVVLRRATSVPDPNDGETETFVRAQRSLRLIDSDVSRLSSGKLPRLVRSTCDESFIGRTTSSWGVCTRDTLPTPTPVVTPTPGSSCGPNPGPTSCDIIG